MNVGQARKVFTSIHCLYPTIGVHLYVFTLSYPISRCSKNCKRIFEVDLDKGTKMADIRSSAIEAQRVQIRVYSALSLLRRRARLRQMLGVYIPQPRGTIQAKCFDWMRLCQPILFIIIDAHPLSRSQITQNISTSFSIKHNSRWTADACYWNLLKSIGRIFCGKEDRMHPEFVKMKLLCCGYPLYRVLLKVNFTMLVERLQRCCTVVWDGWQIGDHCFCHIVRSIYHESILN